MEKDDEIKEQKGTSYDFGARLYDPRVGRWLSRDALEGRQPSQSPYKAMLNNPIFWVDPDGKTEYETIVIKDESTGQSIRLYTSISAKSMTCGCVQTGKEWPVKAKRQSYYDYSHVTTYTFTTDGELTVNHSTEILYDNGSKYIEDVTLDVLFDREAEYGEVYDPAMAGLTMSGGFYMTGKNGQGTKYRSKNVEYVGAIDDLISLLSVHSASGKLKINNKGFKNKQGWDGVQDIMDQMKHNLSKVDKIGSLTDKWKEIIDKYSEVEVEELPGNDRTMSNDSVVTYEDGEKVTTVRKATNAERRSGDTLKVETPKVQN